jgi:glycosyltransferase involved in cell wall biosynthesis
MKILMQNRLDAYTAFGGDTVQMLKTKEELEKLGIEVDISLELEPDLSEYDIIHLFNITRIHETFIQARNCIKQGKPFVFSTIHHSKEDIRNYENKALTGFGGFLRKAIVSENLFQLMKTIMYVIQSRKGMKALLNQVRFGFVKEQKYVLEKASALLPNSIMERDAIEKEFNMGVKDKCVIVPNGIEIEDQAQISAEAFIDKYKVKDFIICAGRIEPRKNQIAIIEALKDTNIPIVFAGAINRKHKKYISEFLKLVNTNNVFYIGKIDREILYSAYAASKVSVLASWFETTGLVGLEAAVTGTNVVMTEKGYTREYFKDKVWYCNPEEVSSLREAILSAYEAPKGKYDFKEEILNNYTWAKAAEVTLTAYESVLMDKVEVRS